MHCFRLWAPNAKKVSVQIAKQKHLLEKQDGGWWQADIDAAGPGVDYAYFLDDPALDDQALALPDPRSPWQPNGIHGSSRLLDHAAFRWTDDAWEAPPFSSAIIYELHIGTFTPEGTLDAAQTKLDSLRELGITHVELMPVNSFPRNSRMGLRRRRPLRAAPALRFARIP
jgi:maltooligosyltrehalose trehalohydrolase